MIFILESVFFGIVLFFLTTIVSRTILQPINQLTKSAKAFEVDKEFIPVKIKSRDELSVLGRAFNTMADKATTAAKNLQVDVNKVKKERDKALVEAILDPLTGLSNRKFMEVELEKLMLASKRYGDDLSLIILDLDHFKKVNNTYGHVTGDTVLKAISSLIKDTMRASDLTIRYGGEEFVVVMHHTASDKATKKAEILRQKIESLRLAELGESGLTVSLGVTQFRKEDKSIESFISRADEALYKAKRQVEINGSLYKVVGCLLCFRAFIIRAQEL